MRLLGGAVAFAVVAGAAGCHHVHPAVLALLRERDDVLAGQGLLGEVITTVGTQVAVARKQLAVGQARLEVEGVDVGYATGADDAVNANHRLQAGDGIVAAAKDGDLATGLPTHFA